MNILQVSTADVGGGAERVGWLLFQAYRQRGHRSRLAVGYRRGNDPDVALLPNAESSGPIEGLFWAADARLQKAYGKMKGIGRLSQFFRSLARPGNALDWWRGIEPFHFPGTSRLLEMDAAPPDVVHCHNLHGNYFDLRALPELSRRVPFVLTLHDPWLLSGHCAYSLGCERWKTGCGQCPDLTLPPAVRRDATDYNWKRKRDWYAASRLYVATPSQWLMDKVKQSILAPALVEAKVVHNGVDLSIFRPGDRREARVACGLPADARIVLFMGESRSKAWKDYATMRAALPVIADRVKDKTLVFVALGLSGTVERIGEAELRYVPKLRGLDAIARYYQAADLYLHAAKEDNFPNTVLEAMACGTPVVATGVGGVPEQFEDGRQGFLVPRGDFASMGERAVALLRDDLLRAQFAQLAAERVRERFDLDRQVDQYLSWYHEIVADWKARNTPLPARAA